METMHLQYSKFSILQYKLIYTIHKFVYIGHEQFHGVGVVAI